MSLFSSPASAADLRKSLNGSAASHLEDIHAVETKYIEVEKKIELDGVDAIASFEQLIESKGGELLKSVEFTDCYWDSEDLLLTRSDHFLRDRDGVWELKVPQRHNGTSTSVYEEITGEAPIENYFSSADAGLSTGRWLSKHLAPVSLPFHAGHCFFDHDASSSSSSSSSLSSSSPAPAEGEQVGSVAPEEEAEEEEVVTAAGRTTLAPFVRFTTKRRQWKLSLGGDHFSIDVDEASFGCCVAEIELMVTNTTTTTASPTAAQDASVSRAVRAVDEACKALGVVAAPNQDKASKFVQFILLHPDLLERTVEHAPGILDLAPGVDVAGDVKDTTKE